MTDYFDFVCSKIEEEKSLLNSISQEIWRTPELCFEEVHAHGLLSNTLLRFGFNVQKHYLLETAFKAEYSSKKEGGPTVAILLEYDALPQIGHACGHNLISEAGLAASIAIKAVMEKDHSLASKLVVIGTPAEETGGGKIKLIEAGAFKDIDVALMVHPAVISSAFAPYLARMLGKVEFKGKEAHAAAFPWEGRNALDAAVACYNSISHLRQQIKPKHRIHAIITEGGAAINIIPAKAVIQLCIRTPKAGELSALKARVEDCIKGAAVSTGCTVTYSWDDSDAYQNVITNRVLGNLYQKYYEKLGEPSELDGMADSAGSTDMGNVSHILPAIHPVFAIPTKGVNHTKEFTEAAGEPAAQKPTLDAAKAMAMTAISVIQNPDIMNQVKVQFAADLLEDLKVK